ncbi:TonB-dependent receptor [uncultured Draconibacterium sp.]|uniref:TonB-dependent receptor n=1 Tax=uncultured Draconibacterium sp. TaxID=1573823 RepID=UPI0029C833C3|nr:TonB-dependent receptor [uncultured Draconibacterium sp.]
MKITLIFLFISVIGVYAIDSYAQTTKLTMNLNDKTIEEVLSKIESESEFRFFYNENVSVEKKVSINIKNKTVFNVLDEILDDTDIKYELKGRQIALYNKGESHAWLSGQQVNITGTVTSSEGEPLPGVSVIVKGTSSGTVTDFNGDYQLSASGSDVLIFSFIGMLSQEVAVNSRTRINVVMQADIVSLEEVVAIGYGTRKKSDLTGAVSVVGAEELTKEVKMSPELAMQGKMAGVFISNPGSDPTARPTVRIRGVGTLGFNDPLYVIDGIPITEGGASSGLAREQDMRGPINIFSMINPNDIKSISVLKDASATAIYGVRASNGVILIQTKRGKEGKAKVNLSASYGIQNIYKRYDVMNVQQYVDAHNEAWNNNPSVTPPSDFYRFFDAGSPHYLGNSQQYTDDWLDEAIVKNAAVQDYNLNVSGGTKMSTYSVGAGYSAQENVMSKKDFERFSFFLNSDHELNKWLKVGESYRFVYTQTDENNGVDFNTASFINPWQPMYDPTNENGLWGYAFPGRTVDGEFMSKGYGNSTRSNPGGNRLQKNLYNMIRNLGTFYAEVTPFDGFRIKGTVSFDYYTNKAERYIAKEEGLFSASRGVLNEEGNTYRIRDNVNTNIVKELLVGYNKSFGKHNFDVILNAMDQQIKWTIESRSIDNNSPIPSWEQRRIDEGWPLEDKGLFVERQVSGLQGYMGRLSYNFDSKYYLDATVRRDGSSKFGPGYKWGTFPSFAAAWRISSEKFMENITWLDDLKIRSGWGQTGNQETKDFAFLSLVNFNPKYSIGTGETTGDGNIVPAAALGDFPIEDMSWETSTTFNIGFDAVLLDNKMSLTAEYYNRLTDGILQTIDIPLVIGALNNPVVNLAEVRNQGFEFQASYNNKIGELGYSLSANLTTVKNEVLSLYRNKPSGGSYGRLEVGQPINFLYGYKTDGIFQSPEEVDEWLANNEDPGNESQKAPGDVRFVDIYGAPTEEDGEYAYRNLNPDGKIDGFDQTYLGKTIPGYYYGFSIGLDYQNWDLSMNFRGVGDVQRINTQGKQSIGAGGSNFVDDYLNRWTPNNPSNVIPRAIENDPSANNRISDRHVEDAGFLRLNNLQVGYSFSGDLLDKAGINNARCYLSGSNLFVITPYSGLDPENVTTPVTFTVGVNLSF